MQKLSILFLLFIVSWQVSCVQKLGKPHHIVVLGSSTAEGAGPKSKDSAWVNLFRNYVKEQNGENEVTNLAVGGYTTYHILPDTATAVTGRAAVDKEHNITKALSLKPDILIINMPSNDIIAGVSIEEFRHNLALLNDIAKTHDIKCFITTTQSRNSDTAKQNALIRMRDVIKEDYPLTYIDFWSGMSNVDGSIKEEYNSGDGVHLNGKAHHIMLERVAGQLKTAL